MKFICTEDIEILAAQGKKELVVDGSTVLMDLARDMARQLGIEHTRFMRSSEMDVTGAQIKYAVLSALLAAGFASTDEMHQAFTATRTLRSSRTISWARRTIWKSNCTGPTAAPGGWRNCLKRSWSKCNSPPRSPVFACACRWRSR